MTGNDYHKKFKELNKSLESLIAHIDARLLDLISKFPDATISDVIKGKYPCKEMTKDWFK
jgi:hypothetical protein